MRFGNPILAIHDAYAINMKGREIGTGGSPIDSNTRAFNQVKAGLIIKAVESQDEHLSALLQFCYAPDGICTALSFNTIYIKLLSDLYRQMKAKESLTYRKMAELSLLANRALHSFKLSSLTGRSQYTRKEIAVSIGRTQLSESIDNAWRTLEDLLWSYRDKAMGAIEDVCVQQCEMIKDRRLESLQKRISSAGVSEESCIRYINNTNNKQHHTLNTLTHHDADVLENHIDAYEAAKKENVKMYH